LQLIPFGNSEMQTALTTLIDRLDNGALAGTDVIRWGCPVPSFGDLETARIATLGLNPSNREFVDGAGKELQGDCRRFHTLDSLGLKSWSDVDARHLQLILESCREYFLGNPYDKWFRRLDLVLSGADTSFYHANSAACHLDLIPYATARKWTELTGLQRSTLLHVAGDTLGLLLRASSIEVLILNGQSVVDRFEEIAGVGLERAERFDWALPRQSGRSVTGVSYVGAVSSVSGVSIGRMVKILGFNHNLQSSYGVTTGVLERIRLWIAQSATDCS
jgi:hypothetical protein